jgi:regulatory protein YycI of two-component signal transduction system YycFG
MRSKEERDLENALAWDGKPGNMDAALEAMRIDKEESEQFFKKAGQTMVRGDAILLDHGHKRVNGDLAKHWFIYEYPERKEVRLLISDQIIDGEAYAFMNGKDCPLFSYL